MNKPRFLAFAVVALALLNIGMLAFFLLRHGMRHEGPKKIIAERLHFDAGQLAAYDKLIEKHRQDIRAKEKEIGAAKKALYSLLQSDNPLGQDSLTAAIGQLQQEVEGIHFRHFADIKNLCKDGQIDDFKEMTADLAHYFSHGAGKMDSN